jgi:hypothetical protein
MGAEAVVDLPPRIEEVLGMSDVGELVSSNHFGLEGAMETLILADRLGMKAARMHNANPDPHQPHAQSGQPLWACECPREARC